MGTTRHGSVAALLWGWASLGTACYGGRGGDDPAGQDGTTMGPADSADSGQDADGSGTGADVPDDLEPSSVPEPLAARLTDTQYRLSVLDILGESLTEQELQWLPRDVPIEGSYSTSVDAQGFNAQYVLGYAYISRTVAERLDVAALRTDFAGCPSADDACLGAFIDGLGRRLFRRPLTNAEHATYVALADAIASEGATSSDDVVRGLVQAFMQAPQFLYRLERETDGEAGEVRRVDGYELASRLSYFLWQSAPDDALLEFAAGPQGDGAFDKQAIAAQVQRMVADPKFARARTAFWGDYSLASTSSFGSTDPQLVQELRESLLATLERISGVGGDAQPLSAVFDGQQYMMTPAVAEIAGAASLGEGLQLYDTAAAQQRQGVVTHPAFLAAIGTTSFVGRGVFMTERLLCQHIAPPPADIAEQIMQTAQMTESMTPREASEFRFGLQAVCIGCHAQFEPIAYGFERYDMQGRYAEFDAQGRALYADGVLPALEDRPEIAFDDALELLSALGDLDVVHRCFVENMAEFGTGRRAHWAGDFLGDAVARFVSDGMTFEALVQALAQGEQLIYSRNVAP